MSRVLSMHMPKQKVAIWLLICIGLLVLVVANGHLIYVAVTSQPDCVEHIREAGSGPPGARYAPAKSSC